jgi:hypothetical protein
VHNFFLAFHVLFNQNYADALVLDVPRWRIGPH